MLLGHRGWSGLTAWLSAAWSGVWVPALTLLGIRVSFREVLVTLLCTDTSGIVALPQKINGRGVSGKMDVSQICLACFYCSTDSHQT